MSQLIDNLREQAKSLQRTIIFPEAEDERVQRAARQFASEGLGRAILIDAPLDAGLPGVSSQDREIIERCSDLFFERRQHKGITREAATEAAANPLLLAALLVNLGEADAAVAGSLASTADVMRAGIWGIGPAAGRKTVSSFFLMHFEDRTWTYADCAVIPDPDIDQLAEIAIDAAENHARLTQSKPRVAMLSFSTRGSAEHPHVDKVRAATERAKEMRPELVIDGEMQFDAAMIPEIASRKAPDSPLAGSANVFVFPDLNSGNIGYKMTQRLAGAAAIGPIVQGLAKPYMDLSRGCSVDDIVNVATIAAVMA